MDGEIEAALNPGSYNNYKKGNTPKKNNGQG